MTTWMLDNDISEMDDLDFSMMLAEIDTFSETFQ